MGYPIVAVVGRPNVGKSTFVNRISQKKDAIVHEERGVTRDRSYHNADWSGIKFTLIDTGGVEMSSDDAFQHSIRTQAFMATEEADAIVMIVEGDVGPTPDDMELARIIKRSSKPIFLAVNKMDEPSRDGDLWEFYSLGLGEPWPISAVHGHGTGDLLDALVASLPDFIEEPVDASIDVAIIGRPNAGKSSLANQLIGLDRTIVSDIAGTTRDAIDTLIDRGDRSYRIIDTAGIRRKSQIDEDVEYYGYVRAVRAIDRAEVALLVIDSTVGLTDQDQRVAGLAQERGCALVILLNKWDLLESIEEKEELVELVSDRLMFVGFAPVLRISALTGRNVQKIWDAVDLAYDNYTQQIPTNRLNKFLTEIREFGHTINVRGKRLRMHYVTQTGTRPPQFTFFANHPEVIDSSFKRYIENRMREEFDLTGTPVELRFRKKD